MKRFIVFDTKWEIADKGSFRRNLPLSYFKDTRREKAPSNKTPALLKSRDMNIWIAVTSNQGFIRGS